MQNCILRYLISSAGRAPVSSYIHCHRIITGGGTEGRHREPIWHRPRQLSQPTPTKNNPLCILSISSPAPGLGLAWHQILCESLTRPSLWSQHSAEPVWGNNEASMQVKLLCCLKSFKTQYFLCLKMTFGDSQWFLFSWIKNHFSRKIPFESSDTTCQRGNWKDRCAGGRGRHHSGPGTRCICLAGAASSPCLPLTRLYTRNSGRIFFCAHKNEVNDAISSQFKV